MFLLTNWNDYRSFILLILIFFPFLARGADEDCSFLEGDVLQKLNQNTREYIEQLTEIETEESLTKKKICEKLHALVPPLNDINERVKLIEKLYDSNFLNTLSALKKFSISSGIHGGWNKFLEKCQIYEETLKKFTSKHRKNDEFHSYYRWGDIKYEKEYLERSFIPGKDNFGEMKAGAGFYLAKSPFHSIEYASNRENSSLLAVDLPKETAIYNLRDPELQAFTKSMREEYKITLDFQEQCNTEGLFAYSPQGWFVYRRNRNSPAEKSRLVLQDERIRMHDFYEIHKAALRDQFTPDMAEEIFFNNCPTGEKEPHISLYSDVRRIFSFKKN
ncbi:MAG: hypothetical protein HQK52_04360 [Oligoflexia bacterium]|nr:hypothetical protein [Oligoflexia bacterium]